MDMVLIILFHPLPHIEKNKKEIPMNKKKEIPVYPCKNLDSRSGRHHRST